MTVLDHFYVGLHTVRANELARSFKCDGQFVAGAWVYVCWCYVRVFVWLHTARTYMGLHFMTGWMDGWKDGCIVILRLRFGEGEEGGCNERLRWWRSRRADIMNLRKKDFLPLIPPHHLLLLVVLLFLLLFLLIHPLPSLLFLLLLVFPLIILLFPCFSFYSSPSSSFSLPFPSDSPTPPHH